MKLIIASNNQHKIREIKSILADKFDDILSLREAGIDHETVEDGTTFMENALKKAREIAEISGAAALADDSGICAHALGGAPGLYSARYAGEDGGHGDDEANKALEAARAVFAGGGVSADMPTTELTADNFVNGSILVSDMLVLGGLAPSKGEAKRLIQQGGILVNDEKITNFSAAVSADAFSDGVIVKKGKKVYHRYTLK